METIRDSPSLFSHESKNVKVTGVIVREIKVLDQYGKAFKQSIKEYSTTKSICGFMVAAVAPIVARSLCYTATIPEVEVLLKKLHDSSLLKSEVEKYMEVVQGQRREYMKENPHDFIYKKDQSAYITDWVAKYEISDVMQIFNPDIENLVFLRYVGYEFPNLVKDVKHEEKKRLEKEEVKFKGQRFIIESFSEKRKLQTIDQWIYEGTLKTLNARDKPIVFIADLLGHYVTFVACKVFKENGQLEDTLFLLNSLKENHAGPIHQEVIFQICQLAFPPQEI